MKNYTRTEVDHLKTEKEIVETILANGKKKFTLITTNTSNVKVYCAHGRIFFNDEFLAVEKVEDYK